MKTCHKCKIEQPLDNFVNNKRSNDGKHSTCKSCVKEYQQSIKDKLRAYQHEYQAKYRKENAAELKEYTKQWQEENRDKTRAYALKSSRRPEAKLRQKEYMRTYNKLWRQRNPEKWKESVRKYNEKLRLKRQNGQ
jgi:exopolyphosphatase/pppGpp-phosphohydrolase